MIQLLVFWRTSGIFSLLVLRHCLSLAFVNILLFFLLFFKSIFPALWTSTGSNTFDAEKNFLACSKEKGKELHM